MKRRTVVILVVALALGVATSALASGRRITCYTAQTRTLVPFCGNIQETIRWQSVIEQSVIRYAGNLNEIHFYSANGRAGRFDNFVVWVCHTTRTNLSRTFDENYYGSARRVKGPVSFTTPARVGWFPLGLTSTYAYNNRNHLLIELRYYGDNGVGVEVYNAQDLGGNRTIWSFNRTASTAANAIGRAFHWVLYFDYYTATEPTSLGRVKALYR